MPNDCKPLLYSHYDVTFQEVPGEVSLVFDITGCLHRCQGCHSQFLWEYTGFPLLADMPHLLGKYSGMITCVCFMGGDQNKDELLLACRVVKQAHLKTCLYSGLTALEFYKLSCAYPSFLAEYYFDYIKLGPYIESFGGLSDKSTNQRFYQLVRGAYLDKTYLFQKEYK